MSSSPTSVSADQSRIAAVQAAHGFDQTTMILTSRDPRATAMMDDLPAERLQEGFAGKLIPIVFGPATDADVEADLGTTTGEHEHETSGFHQIVEGRARIEGPDTDEELSPGDWAYIPAGVQYTLTVIQNAFKVKYRHI